MKYTMGNDAVVQHPQNHPYPMERPGFDAARFIENTNSSLIQPQCDCKALAPASGSCTCGHGGTKQFIYVSGDIIPRFPSLSLENEFYQVAVTDPVDLHLPFSLIAFKYLREPRNLYIARELNWIFQVYGFLDMYAIKVTTNRQLSELIESLAPRPNEMVYDILIGEKMPGYLKVRSSQQLQYVMIKQLYEISATDYVKGIIKAIQKSGLVDARTDNDLSEQAADIFSNALQLIKKNGDDEKSRAMNFIVLRYMDFYLETWALQYKNKDAFQLQRVSENPVEVYGQMKIVTIIFTYQSKVSAATVHYSVTVDVSTEFPFIVVPWAKYYSGY
ncbi:hypothetical protein DVR12_00065 [Chitinophaga silvatica]|uniref:PatG C-terminal domain-containing protein n=1 Tax=Chitinophaga silvatica TaxID=2282649 RepID=A0A3E1YFQ6_9BACT|nr:hypothetical protein [Chitinophaga silvatica]RFS26221.1 hypothetical protein DVR12_00065 [Chitinophaga silvatica]